jgi:tRNA pseudouridine55 synthase/H/ACA ribonucleoprotein complex subunit 4
MSYTGILLVDKPRGPSSHQVAAWVGNMFKSNVGHAGTLDPMVSGVLVIMLGKAMQLASLLLLHEKEYVACLRLHADIPRERIEETMRQFTGRIYQRPPRHSAVKRALRIRVIHQIELLDMQERLVLIRIHCETGTYIRSLCVHIGRMLGCGSQMIELRRTRSGGFSVEKTHTLHDIRDAVERDDEETIRSMLLPPEEAIIDIPKIVARPRAVDAVAHGAILAGVGILQCDSFVRGQSVAIVTGEGKLVALAEAIRDSAKIVCGEPGFVAKSTRVFISPSDVNK